MVFVANQNCAQTIGKRERPARPMLAHQQRTSFFTSGYQKIPNVGRQARFVNEIVDPEKARKHRH